MSVTRIILSLLFAVLFSLPVLAGCGVTDYSLHAAALKDMNVYVLYIMDAALDVVFACCAILCIYSATTIYVKMQMGEDGVIKAIATLIGTCIFAVCAVFILPAFFGIVMFIEKALAFFGRDDGKRRQMRNYIISMLENYNQ